MSHHKLIHIRTKGEAFAAFKIHFDAAEENDEVEGKSCMSMAANTIEVLDTVYPARETVVINVYQPRDHNQVVWTGEKVKIQVGWPSLKDNSLECYMRQTVTLSPYAPELWITVTMEAEIVDLET